MTEKLQLSGLCINCLEVQECKYRVNHTKPIIFCEEFSCTDLSESKNNITREIPEIENSINSSLKGICSNCDNVETCNLQKPGANVMNCEEYR